MIMCKEYIVVMNEIYRTILGAVLIQGRPGIVVHID